MSRTRIRDIDRGAKRLVRRTVGASQPRGVTVGIHEDDGSASKDDADGLTVVEVGAFHEFGGDNNRPPRRSFIRDWADEKQDEHRAMMTKLAMGIMKGTISGQAQALELFGVRAVGEVQRRMSQGIPPALAYSTIEMKGSSMPLIDTGQLRSAIAYKVER